MTDAFIKNILALKKENIQENVFIHARLCFLDYIACAVVGSKQYSKKERTYLKSFGSEVGISSVIGHQCKSTMQIASLMNGMSAHVAELDDGHRRGAVHVGATVFSAILAVAEQEHLSSEDFLYGAIIGYETTIRLACAIQPGNKLKGYHATGTCGTVGAALGIAAALGQSFEQMKSTLSAAVTSAAGTLEMQEDGSDLKPLNVGRAAMDAVAAAYIGQAGFKAPKDALGGKRGFLKIMTDDPHPDFLTDFDKDAPLAITQIYQKSYAACRHAHPAIEAALNLRPSVNNQQSTINSIIVEAYKLAVAGHDHTDIMGVSSAKMSIPFSVALALVKGSAGMEDYSEENVTDNDILALTKKVNLIENPELSALVPNKRASILKIKLNDGTVLSHRVDYPKGEPENPLSMVEIYQKFISLATASGISKESYTKVISIINSQNFDIKSLLDLLS